MVLAGLDVKENSTNPKKTKFIFKKFEFFCTKIFKLNFDFENKRSEEQTIFKESFHR
jgi:hypothetical protein